MNFSIYVYSWPLIDCVSLRDPEHATQTDLDIDGFIISHIISEWYRDPNPASFQDQTIWNLRSENMERTAIKYV